MPESFFSRWSRRKQDAREGPAPAAAPEDHERQPSPAPQAPAGQAGAGALPPAGALQAGAPGAADRPGEQAAADAPTLEQARSLTPDADFGRFVQADVAPEVRNAALRRLFTDPHFNRMDGLDTYIDDYSLPDPLPEASLRRLAGARFLGLVQPEEAAGSAAGREVADDGAAPGMAQSAENSNRAAPAPAHADPDLRLQQDHAPGPAVPGAGAG